MTHEEFAAFVDRVRADCAAALIELGAAAECVPLRLRAECAAQARAWIETRALFEDLLNLGSEFERTEVQRTRKST
jgi:hypothetical protein